VPLVTIGQIAVALQKSKEHRLKSALRVSVVWICDEAPEVKR
jgi:hypothetical protein